MGSASRRARAGGGRRSRPFYPPGERSAPRQMTAGGKVARRAFMNAYPRRGSVRSPSRTGRRLFLGMSRSVRSRLFSRLSSLGSVRACVVRPSPRRPPSRSPASPGSGSSAPKARTRAPETPGHVPHPRAPQAPVGRIPPLPASRHGTPPRLAQMERCPSQRGNSARALSSVTDGSEGRGGRWARRTVRCSSRWVWSSFRPGSGRGLDPGWGDGRSPSRRPGGPAPKRWQRRPCRPPVRTRTRPRNRTASANGGRRSAGDIWRTGRPGDVRTRGIGRTPCPRTLPERGLSGGIEGGRSTPRQSVRLIHGVGWLPTDNGSGELPKGTDSGSGPFPRSTLRCSAKDPPVRAAKHRRACPPPGAGLQPRFQGR